jgi:hypothetical protein
VRREDLDAAAEQLELDAAKLERLSDIMPASVLERVTGLSADEVAELAQTRVRERRQVERQDGNLNPLWRERPAETTPRAVSPDPACEVDPLAAAERADLNRTMAFESTMPAELRRHPAGPPPTARYRPHMRGRRRLCTRLDPSKYWLRYGSHADDVIAWLRVGLHRQDPIEREIVARLRAAAGIGLQGEVVEEKLRPIAPLAALAFVLWFAAKETKKKGYCAALKGTPRGELARLMAHRPRLVRVVPRTVTTYLRKLRELLGARQNARGEWEGGLLRFWQPEPEEAEDRDLPRSRTRRADGTWEVQAVNVYWFADESFLSSPVGRATRITPGGSPNPLHVVRDHSNGNVEFEREPIGVGEDADGVDPAPHGRLTSDGSARSGP